MIEPIVVIGSGPAGLSAAIAASAKGAPVEVMEYRPSPGRKLLASGAGKCNLTNRLGVDEMIREFPKEQRRFIAPALRSFSPRNLLDFFAERGVPCDLAADGFHYFPASGRARDLLDVLLGELRASGVRLHTATPVEAFRRTGDRVTGVLAGGRCIDCSAVIVAAGGPGYPELGGMRSIEKVLRNAGIPVCEVLPALAGLQCREAHCAQFSGLVFQDAEAWLDGMQHHHGDVIFTHRGVSGPAIQNLSGCASRMLREGKDLALRINLRSEDSAGIWRERFREFRRSEGNKAMKALLSNYFTRAWSEWVCEKAGAGVAGRMTAASEKILIELLTAHPLTVHAPESWERAMCSTGGADREAIDPRTLRSRVLSNCFFAGEVLDVDGPCGGFNIQWAFSSGRLAGSACAAALAALTGTL